MVNIEQYHQIKKELGADVKLIVVSKTKPAEQIQILYNEGHRKFERIERRKCSKNMNSFLRMLNGIYRETANQ